MIILVFVDMVVFSHEKVLCCHDTESGDDGSGGRVSYDVIAAAFHDPVAVR